MFRFLFYLLIQRGNLISLYVAPPAMSAAAYRRLLSRPRDRGASLLPDSARPNGSSHDPSGSQEGLNDYQRAVASP